MHFVGNLISTITYLWVLWWLCHCDRDVVYKIKCNSIAVESNPWRTVFCHMFSRGLSENAVHSWIILDATSIMATSDNDTCLGRVYDAWPNSRPNPAMLASYTEAHCCEIFVHGHEITSCRWGMTWPPCCFNDRCNHISGRFFILFDW